MNGEAAPLPRKRIGPLWTPFLGDFVNGEAAPLPRKRIGPRWSPPFLGMSAPGTSKTSRPMTPLPKDYHRAVSEIETNNLLRSTFTDDCRTQKGDQKTCLLCGLSYFWRPTSSLPSSCNTSSRLVRAGSLLCVYGWGVQGCFRTDPERVSLGEVLRVSGAACSRWLLEKRWVLY